jgi:hypothetical protein
MEQKTCSKCNIIKNICEFRKDKTKRDGYYSSCKSCKLEYRRKNKEQVNLSAKKLRDLNKLKNPDKFYLDNNVRVKRYTQKNKEKIKLKRQQNVDYRLRCSLRARTINFLKSINAKKTNKTLEIVGCTSQFLKEYLENQFTGEMSWDNYGKWHIDHIIPLSSAKNKEDTYKLCHYTNLQPLWAKDNLVKSNKNLHQPQSNNNSPSGE